MDDVFNSSEMPNEVKKMLTNVENSLKSEHEVCMAYRLLSLHWYFIKFQVTPLRQSKKSLEESENKRSVTYLFVSNTPSGMLD